MSLKIQPIPLDKDSGENVAPIVVKSIHALSANLTYVKKWADKQEDSLKQSHEQRKELERRLAASDSALADSKRRVEDLAALLEGAAAERHTNFDSVALCLDQLQRSTRSLISRISRSLAADAGGADSDDEEGTLVVRGGESDDDAGEETEEESGGEGDEATEPAGSRPGGGEQPSPGAGEAPPRTLAELASSGQELRSELQELRRVAEGWGRRREEERKSTTALADTAKELRSSSEQTRERLLSWRDLVKESSRVVDCLANSLAETQGAVEELQATQVRKCDVDEAVGERARQLEELQEAASRRMDDLVETVDAQARELERSLQEAQRQTSERITDHATKVAQMVERNVNPITAYLNTMHIKADGFRSELDALARWTPKVDARLDEVVAGLIELDASHNGHHESLASRLETVAGQAAARHEDGDGRHAQLEGAVGALEGRLAQDLEQLRAALAEAEADLAALRRSDFATLAQDLKSLEQKVAKWVHAQPLPAKISEARLFSLEARLADECDARLSMEQQMGLRVTSRPSAGGMTPRAYAARSDASAHGSDVGGGGGGVGTLPQLPQQPWSSGDASARSPMYDAYRLQASQRMPKA